MANWKFQKWAAEATSRIVFPPDRWEVEQELRGHLQDRYEDALAHGMTAEEAENHALAAMGSAGEIAVELGLIHRPFWGRFHLLTKRLVTVMLCLTIFFFGCYLILFSHYSDPVYYRYDPFEDTYAFDDAGSYRQKSIGEPVAIDFSDGYLFILQRYALWEETHAVTLETEDQMYLQLQVISLVPWNGHADISRWFRAEDNLGNQYDAAYMAGSNPSLRSSMHHTGPCVYTHIISFSEYRSQEASRMELTYDRAGRKVLLSFDLTGGGA